VVLGLKLYLVCTGDGMPIMWCLATPKLGEREVLAALLEHNHHLLRDGHVLLADKGFAGKQFTQLTESMGLELLRPDRKDETYRNGNLGGVRQRIENADEIRAVGYGGQRWSWSATAVNAVLGSQRMSGYVSP
jgi:hypothetical protein